MTEQRNNWNRKSQIQLQTENHCTFYQLHHVHLEVLSLGPVVATVWGGEDVIEELSQRNTDGSEGTQDLGGITSAHSSTVQLEEEPSLCPHLGERTVGMGGHQFMGQTPKPVCSSNKCV